MPGDGGAYFLARTIGFPKALELAATYQGIAQSTEDHDEAVRAFLEKREPVFSGR